MRRFACGALLLLLLAGCEKSFDERYADAQKKMSEQAASIDKELAAKASEAPIAPPTAPDAAASGGSNDAMAAPNLR